MAKESSKLKSVKVAFTLPFIGKIEGLWEADAAQQEAAWEMYVELITRIAVVELRDDEGLLREALSSLHALFGVTREILRRHGPGVARSKKPSDLSFGYVAVAVLNLVLRPMLAKWHPLLSDYEARRVAPTSSWEHEKNWEHATELRAELRKVRGHLTAYAEILAEVAGVESLIVPDASSNEP